MTLAQIDTLSDLFLILLATFLLVWAVGLIAVYTVSEKAERHLSILIASWLLIMLSVGTIAQI